LRAFAAEALGLLVLAERAERLRKQARDRRAEAPLTHPYERLVALAQDRRGGARVAGEHLDEERLLGGDRDPDRQAQLLKQPPAARDQLARRLEIAAHRLEHGPPGATERLGLRLVGRGLGELLAAHDALLDRQRAEDGADQEPADALG